MSESQRRYKAKYRRSHREQVNEYQKKWAKEHSTYVKKYVKRRREYKELKRKHPTDLLPLTEEFLKTLTIERRAIYERTIQALIAETA